jgi:uncharacterized protein YbcI
VPDERQDERTDGHEMSGANISTGAIQAFRTHTGHEPSQAHVTIEDDIVVLVLKNTLSKQERGLIAAGEAAVVSQTRSAFQRAMRSELIQLVEENVSRKVTAFMSLDNVHPPEMACEIFVLDGSQPTASRA